MTDIRDQTAETAPVPKPRRTWMLAAGAAAVAVVAVAATVIVGGHRRRQSRAEQRLVAVEAKVDDGDLHA